MVQEHCSQSDRSVRTGWLVSLPLTLVSLTLLFLLVAGSASYPASAGIAKSASSPPAVFMGGASCAPSLAFTVTSNYDPMGMAYDAANGRLFVANQNGPSGGNLLVVFTQHRVYLPIIVNSWGGASSATGYELENARPNTALSATWPITRVVPGLPGARSVAYDSARNRIYVAGANKVYVVDGSTYNQLDPTQLQDSDAEAFAVAYNPAFSKIYVTDFKGHRITIIDAQDGHIIATLRHNNTDPNQLAEPAHIAVDSTTGRVYVANHNFGNPNGWVSVLSGSNNQILAKISFGGDLYGMAADSTHHRIYVSSISAAKVFAIDSNTDTPLSPDSIQIVRQNPPGKPVPLRMVGVDPDVGANVHLWLTSSTEDQFGMDKLILLSFDPAVWPPASLSPVAMDVGQSSKDGLVVDPGWGRVFVSSTGSNLVTVAQDGAALCSTPLAPSGGELVAVVETH